MSTLKLVAYNGSGKSWSVKNMLEDVLAAPDIPLDTAKGIVILLNDSPPSYNYSMAVAGMGRIELIALLEAVKLAYVRTLTGDLEA